MMMVVVVEVDEVVGAGVVVDLVTLSEATPLVLL